MISLRSITVLLLAVLLCGQLQALDNVKFLKAIAMVETGENDHAIGKSGEITRWQLTPQVVAEFGRNPESYINWIRREFRRRNVYECPFNLALAYTAGVDKATTGRASVLKYQYAVRVSNLYEYLSKKE